MRAAGPSALSFLQSYLQWGLRSHHPIFGVDVEVRTAGGKVRGHNLLPGALSPKSPPQMCGEKQYRRWTRTSVNKTGACWCNTDPFCYCKAEGPRLRKFFREGQQMRVSPRKDDPFRWPPCSHNMCSASTSLVLGEHLLSFLGWAF